MNLDEALRALFELGYSHGVEDANAELVSANPVNDNYAEYDRAKYEVLRAMQPGAFK